MKPVPNINPAEISDSIGSVRRRLAVMAAALDGLSPMFASHPAFAGIEEICHELDLQLESILTKLAPETAK